MFPEPLAHGIDVDVQHHHHEQEQHHHRAQIHQHQSNGQKLCLEQQPNRCRLRKRKDEVQHCMHRVACSDHPEGREKQHNREKVEETSLGVHESGLYRKSGGRR
ncbi:hypothetical protein D3C87_1863250 [compost metagenome]